MCHLKESCYASTTIHCLHCETTKVSNKNMMLLKNFSCESTIVIWLFRCFLSFLIFHHILKALENDIIFLHKIYPESRHYHQSVRDIPVSADL